MIISLLYLHFLGEAVDVADIPVMLVVGHVEGRQVERGSDAWRRAVGAFLYLFEREFRLLKGHATGPYKTKQRGSRLGSLSYDNITTLTSCPRRSRGCG
jgi:hypothetical protein